MERKYFRNLTEDERRQLKENIFRQLKIDENKTRVRRIFDRKLIGIAVAASVLIAVGLLTFRTNSTNVTGKILIARTGDGETKQVTLADSSVVILNEGSALYSTADYTSASREVFLTGNGFFKVRKLGSRRNFIVHASDLRVTVLGTHFNVNARSDRASVSLTSGKVQVNKADDDNKAAYMLPGDQLQLNSEKTTFIKQHIDTSMYSAWTRGEWSFKNLTLVEITRLIQEYYDVDVVFADKRKMNLQMTALIPVNTLQALLNVISATLPVDISQNKKQLLIK